MTKRIVTFFTDSGTPKTGLTPTIIIRDLTDASVAVNGSNMTESGSGYYYYDFTTYDIDHDYAFRSDGGATLSDGDRYTWGGNDSYVNDIWDDSISNHQVIGSLASEIRASHGETIGGGNGAAMFTADQAKFIAEKVWEVMLNNDQNAREVLLTRSDFDAIKDRVILETPIEFPTESINDLSKSIKKIDKDISTLKDKKIQVNPTPVTVNVDIPKSLINDIIAVKSKIKELSILEPHVVEVERMIEPDKLIGLGLAVFKSIKDILTDVEPMNGELVKEMLGQMNEKQTEEMRQMLKIILLKLTRTKYEVLDETLI